jgi:hypothetical protein
VKLAPLATELVARGHIGYFAARDIATAEKALQKPAVRFLQSPCLLSRPAGELQNPRTFAQVLAQVGFRDDRQLRALVESWRNLFELIRPELIVCEHSPAALVASRWTAARRVVLGTGFSLPPDVSPLPDLCPWMGPPDINLARHENAILNRVNRLLMADGLTPLDRLSQLYADVDDSFLLTYPELDHHPNRRPAEYLGSWAPSSGIEPEWPSGTGPRVFAYLKSAATLSLLQRALAVLRELPVKTLAYVPRASKNILAMQSPSLRICREPVNISTALPQCDLALLNGTAGTATQSLLSGVPVVMLPLYLEQVIFSRRVVELGAGLMCAPNRIELLAGRIWHALQDDRYRLAARSFAGRYTAYDPLATQRRINDRIEAQLESAPSCFRPESTVVQTYA